MNDRAPEGRFALLADGSTVEIQQATPADAHDVRVMHERLSPANAYFRFFSFSEQAPEREAKRLCRPPGPDHVALLARLGGQLVGVASYEPTGTPGAAEVAFAVADQMHGRGIGTLLLEHLVSLASQRHLTTFTADTMPENLAMLRVFASAGLQVRRRFADGVIQLTMPLPSPDTEQFDSYLDAVADRASRADVASLRPLLQPTSVAVVGASRSRGSVGREILHNIVAGGFRGDIYPVNAHGGEIEGLTCLRSAVDLPDAVDVAVIAVPAEDVARVAEECGSRGVHALLVVSAGLGGAGADLLAICRRHGMRLVGPNTYGVAVPALRLNASFAASAPLPGDAGLVVQSGGIGIALLAHLSRLGFGVSSFASVGDKYDVSGNDMLTWWEQDEQTGLAVLYLESFGNPRGFARTARRVARRLPVLTVIAGRSAAGQRAAESRTAGGTPLVTQEALFAQAGIIATHNLGDLVDAAALLACQPLPAGRRVAIVSNAGGAGSLAADACVENGLAVAELDAGTQRALARLLPSRSAVAGPVDTTAAVCSAAFRTCLEQVGADDGVDALLAIGVRTAAADLTDAIRTARVDKPLAAVLLDRPESVSIISSEDSADDGAGPGGRPPVTPRDAGPGGRPPVTPRDAGPGGRPPVTPRGAGPEGRAPETLRAPGFGGRRGRRIPVYGFPESAARALGHVVRYQDWRESARGVVPELADVDTEAARALVSGFLTGSPLGGWLPAADAAALLACYQIPLLPMLSGGVETMVGVVQEPVFGPLVVFGLGGVATDVLADRSARLTPLTDVDAAAMIVGLRAAPLLLGRAGSPAADTSALAGLLLRVSRLADDLPEVVELDLNPVLARPDGAAAVEARVRVATAAPRDPFLRQLR